MFSLQSERRHELIPCDPTAGSNHSATAAAPARDIAAGHVGSRHGTAAAAASRRFLAMDTSRAHRPSLGSLPLASDPAQPGERSRSASGDGAFRRRGASRHWTALSREYGISARIGHATGGLGIVLESAPRESAARARSGSDGTARVTRLDLHLSASFLNRPFIQLRSN